MAEALPDERRKGTIYGLLAYGAWGLFPLYFHALIPSGALEVLVHRILWTLVFCVLVMAVRRDLGWVRGFLRRPRLVAGTTAASLALAINWLVYVFAVITGRTYEAALGYFLNPLVTVAFGVFLLGESLRRAQLIALCVGAIAVVVMVIGGGGFPWIAIALALSWATYGLIKKKVGLSLQAMHGLAAETIVLVPIAIGLWWWLAASGESTFGSHGAAHTGLLLASGVVTALPLLAFAAAARRIPLVTIGLMQFMTPGLQLLVGVWLLDEHVATARWVGFAIVWLALIILSVDAVRVAARSRGTRAGQPKF